jgi:hypothetical protein
MAVTNIVGHRSYGAAVPSGETDTIALTFSSIRPTVAVYPGAGGTLTVQYSVSPLASVQGGTALWTNWPHNAASSPRLDFVQGPVTGIRCSALVSEGMWEILS